MISAGLHDRLTVRNDAESLYPNTRVTDTIPLPIRDARGGDTQPPFYNGDEMQPFWGDGQENTVHIEDSPDLGPAPWTDGLPGAQQPPRAPCGLPGWPVRRRARPGQATTERSFDRDS